MGEMNLVKSLKNAGLDPTQPTTWLLEGLPPYLPRPVLLSVAKEIVKSSAPGSGRWGDSFTQTSVDQGMVFHGVPFASGCDDYGDILQGEAGFDQSTVMDFTGIWLDRVDRCVKIDDRYKLTTTTTRGKTACLMIKASKTK